MIARVILDTRSGALDRLFDYSVPASLEGRVTEGTRVSVPFRGSRSPVRAFVTGLFPDGESEVGADRLKPVLSAYGDPLCGWLAKLVFFLREEYFCTYAEALSTVFPGWNTPDQAPPVRWEASAGAPGLLASSRAPAQKALFVRLFSGGGTLSGEDAKNLSEADKRTLRALEKKGVVRRTAADNAAADPVMPDPVLPDLTAQQRAALAAWERERAVQDVFLLHGVTGSGKTRVLFEMADRVMREGGECILLVPEIALTPQMIALARARFGPAVSLIHSRVAASERRRAAREAREGTVKLMLGARSALFTPFSNLKLILIDEEHENSYKSSQTPRYDTVRVAREAASITGAGLVLSSATPSAESFYRARTGEYSLMSMSERVNGRALPEIEVVDMRRELYSGNRSAISGKLMESLAVHTGRGAQALLFLNRRGFSSYVFCRSCGARVTCPDCSVSMTYHAWSKRLICHYCSSSMEQPAVCPSCGSSKIRYMGSGTEKIEEEVRRAFPSKKVVRLDSDTAREKGAAEGILAGFASGDGDILVGTQMIVKGLDFPSVTLVGVLLADSALGFPDINAASRAFQLTAQAAGRAGRGQAAGKVVMQAYEPENPVLVFASRQDYEGFYAYDIDFRRSMGYPPFTEIMGFFTGHEDGEVAEADCAALHAALDRVRTADPAVRLLAPAPAYIQKLKGKYMFHTLLVYPPGSPVKKAVREQYNAMRAGLRSSVFVEVNPVTLL